MLAEKTCINDYRLKVAHRFLGLASDPVLEVKETEKTWVITLGTGPLKTAFRHL